MTGPCSAKGLGFGECMRGVWAASCHPPFGRFVLLSVFVSQRWFWLWIAYFFYFEGVLRAFHQYLVKKRAFALQTFDQSKWTMIYLTAVTLFNHCGLEHERLQILTFFNRIMNNFTNATDSRELLSLLTNSDWISKQSLQHLIHFFLSRI